MVTAQERPVASVWGRSHDVQTLLIVDGAIVVTAAGLNPPRTIQALALFVADTIKCRLASLIN